MRVSGIADGPEARRRGRQEDSEQEIRDRNFSPAIAGWAFGTLRAPNSKLKSSEYSVPVLGLIFLRYADHKLSAAEAELAGQSTGRRQIGPADYQARGVLYLPTEARFSNLLRLPEGANVGQAINDGMRAIEAENPDLWTRVIYDVGCWKPERL